MTLGLTGGCNAAEKYESVAYERCEELQKVHLVLSYFTLNYFVRNGQQSKLYLCARSGRSLYDFVSL